MRAKISELLLAGHGLELTAVDGVGEQVDQLAEMIVGGEGIGRLQEPELDGIGGEDLAEGLYLRGRKTFGFEYFTSGLDTIFVLGGLEHLAAELVDIVIRSIVVTVGIYVGRGRLGRGMLLSRVRGTVGCGARGWIGFGGVACC